MILCLSSAYAEEGDESWLDAARSEEEAEESEPEDASDPSVSDFRTFGTQLDLFGLDVSWSGYGDLLFEWAPYEREMTFEASHFNPILGARLSEHLWSEVEIEFEDSGTEVKLEYAILDYTRLPALGLRMGQFLVPIGHFNEILHPSFRWPQVARPAMFRDIVPAVWSETGLMARGTIEEALLSLKYSAYVANGLGSDFDPDVPEPIRAMRDNAEDENYDLATGGQVGLSLLPGRIGETEISVSGYTGAIDESADLRFSIADLALSSSLGPLTLRAEYARNFLGDRSAPLTALGEGLYAQSALRIGRFTPSIRYDLVRQGLASGAPAKSSSLAATSMVRLYTFWNVRAEILLPLEGSPEPELSAMSAFFF